MNQYVMNRIESNESSITTNPSLPPAASCLQPVLKRAVRAIFARADFVKENNCDFGLTSRPENRKKSRLSRCPDRHPPAGRLLIMRKKEKVKRVERSYYLLAWVSFLSIDFECLFVLHKQIQDQEY